MLVGILLALSLAAPPGADAPVIRSQTDLPHTRFQVGGPPSAGYMTDTFLRVSVPALKSEAERLLRDYRIEDPAIAQRLRLGLAAIALLQNHPADASRLITLQRAQETKPQLQRVGFMLTDALAAGLGRDGQMNCAAAARRITDVLKATSPELAREEALFRYGRVQVSSPLYYAGTVVGAIDPVADKDGRVDVLDGMLLAIWRAEGELLPQCREPLTAAFRAWLSAPANQPVDIWSARLPGVEAFAGARPVTVAVWDTGIDLQLFGGKMALDPAEPFDGRDNDANGVVDDIHGPTFDRRFLPVTSPLAGPSPTLAPRLGFQMAIDKGQLDINYGLDTPEARVFAERSRVASASDQGDDVTLANELFLRSHGTWVASTIADGADWVRLYNVRAMVLAPEAGAAPTFLEDNERWIAAMPALGARLRGGGVRIVNMSWTVNADTLAMDIMSSGIEADPDKALARAQTLYRQLAEAMEKLVRDCPDILFVIGAGNSNQSDDVMAGLPQGLHGPNVLVVGAASISGRASTFTTFGPSVRLYALGEKVAVRAPGGMTMFVDGTSLASPMVSRAAAGMLAVNPGLHPADLIEGLLATATEGDGGMRLLHPANALAWARGHP